MPGFATPELDTLHGGHLCRSASLFLTALLEQERRQHQLAAASRAHCSEQLDSLRRNLATPLNTAHNYFHLLQHQSQEPLLQAPLAALGNALSELHQRLQPNGDSLEHSLDLNTELLRLIDDQLDRVRVESQLSPDLPHLDHNQRAIRRLLHTLFTALGQAVTTGSRMQLRSDARAWLNGEQYAELNIDCSPGHGSELLLQLTQLSHSPDALISVDPAVDGTLHCRILLPYRTSPTEKER